MVLDIENVLLRTSFDILSPIRILQCIVRVFKVLDAWPYIRDHHCLAVAAQRIF